MLRRIKKVFDLWVARGEVFLSSVRRRRKKVFELWAPLAVSAPPAISNRGTGTNKKPVSAVLGTLVHKKETLQKFYGVTKLLHGVIIYYTV